MRGFFLPQHHSMDTYSRIESAANNTATSPTPAQAAAGNYKKGRVVVHGFKIAIENPRNSVRSGVDTNGKAWQNRMAAHYGHFEKYIGADGDGMDVFLGPVPESESVWVINQLNIGSRSFDEHKVMLGFPDKETAKAAYLHSYDQGWQGLGDMVACSVEQLRWWLKFGNKNTALIASALPYEGKNSMTQVEWDSSANPVGKQWNDVLSQLRLDDQDDAMLDAVENGVIDYLDADCSMIFDALVVPFAKLDLKMQQLQLIMKGVGGNIEPIAMQVTDPYKQRGTTNVAAIFELSDGQAITIVFHNPDSTPNKITPQDEMVSWKWLLNKKDVTIVVAPERGEDLNPREVARRLMKLAEKNSERFKKANEGRAARMAEIEDLQTGYESKQAIVAALDAEIADLQAKVNAIPAKKPIKESWWNTPVADKYSSVYLVGKSRGKDSLTFSSLDGGKYAVMLSMGGIGGEFTGTPDEAKHWLKGRLQGMGDAMAGNDMTDDQLKAKLKLVKGDDVLNSLGDQSPTAINVTGNELGDFPDTKEGKKALREAAEGRLVSIMGKWIKCPALNADVEIRRTGIKKVISHSADARKLKLVSDIEKIIGSAVKLSSRKPYDGDSDKSAVAYHILRTEVSLDASTIAVRTVVKEDNNGKFHYDMTVHASDAIFDSANEEGHDESRPPVTATNGGGTDPSRIVRHQLDLSLADDNEVINLFIEGEEPGSLDLNFEDKTKSESVDLNFEDKTKSVANAVLPDGWSESRPGGMATSNDPVNGGIIDSEIVSGKWFVIPNNKALAKIEGLDSREEAFAALTKAIADLQPSPNAEEQYVWKMTQAEWSKIHKDYKGSPGFFPGYDKSALKLINGATTLVPVEIIENEKTASLADGKAALKALSPFLSAQQRKVVASMMSGEEGQFFIDKMIELKKRVDTMPKTYERDGLGDESIAYLHYFRGSADWYITEKDRLGEGTEQAFGQADLGYGGELGYISIAELTINGVELDFYFEPTTLAAINGTDEPDQSQQEPNADAYAKSKAVIIEAINEVGGEVSGEWREVSNWQYIDMTVREPTGNKLQITLGTSGEVMNVNGRPHDQNGSVIVTKEQLIDALKLAIPHFPMPDILANSQVAEQKTEETTVELTAPQPEAAQSPENHVIDTEREDAKVFLNSVIDKTADLIDPDVADRVVVLFEQYQNDPELGELASKAVDSYTEFAMSV